MNLRWLYPLILGLLIVGCPGQAADKPQSRATQLLTQMDAILDQAGSYAAFAANGDLQKRYYAALKEYYGGYISFEIYTEIFSQIDQLDEKIPGFSKRIWQKSDPDYLRINAIEKAFYREVDSRKWNDYLNDYQAQLIAVGGDRSVDSINLDIKKLVDLFQEQLTLKIPQETDRAKSKRISSATAGIVKDPLFKHAMAAYFSLYMSSLEGKTLLRSGDSDDILNGLDGLMQTPEDIFAALGMSNVSPLLISGIKPQILRSENLLEKRDVFVPNLGKTVSGDEIEQRPSKEAEYELVKPSRFFHAFFAGYNECVGGKELGQLLPERWAVAALKGAREFFVHKNGKHSGQMLMVPVKNIQTGETFISLDLTSPDFQVVTDFENEDDKGTVKMSLLGISLERLKSHLPKSWKKFLVSADSSIAGTNHLSHLRHLLDYTWGPSQGHTKDYELDDPYAAKIPGTVKKYGKDVDHYEGRMVIEVHASLDENTPVREIVPADYGAIKSGIDNPQALQASLAKQDILTRNNWIHLIETKYSARPELMAVARSLRSSLINAQNASEIVNRAIEEYDTGFNQDPQFQIAAAQMLRSTRSKVRYGQVAHLYDSKVAPTSPVLWAAMSDGIKSDKFEHRYELARGLLLAAPSGQPELQPYLITAWGALVGPAPNWAAEFETYLNLANPDTVARIRSLLEDRKISPEVANKIKELLAKSNLAPQSDDCTERIIKKPARRRAA